MGELEGDEKNIVIDTIFTIYMGLLYSYVIFSKTALKDLQKGDIKAYPNFYSSAKRAAIQKLLHDNIRDYRLQYTEFPRLMQQYIY